MKKIFQKYWLLTLLACVAAIAIFVKVFFKPIFPMPTVVSINPAAGVVSVFPTEIRVEFDYKIDGQKEKFSLLTTPAQNSSLSGKENILTINFQSLSPPEGKLLFELRYENKPLYSWSYEMAVLPTPTPLAERTERGNPQAEKEIVKKTTSDYPLINFVPYESENFSINYLGPLELGVKIKKGDKSEVKWEVYDWLQKKGVAPDSHKIVWL